MISARLSEAAAWVGGTLQGEDRRFTGVSTDTRTLSADQLYVALAGENFDGHEFVAEAAKKCAAGALVSSEGEHTLPLLHVANTRLGLGALAAAWRKRNPIPLVAITGSNGKTTVKEMVAAILRVSAQVLATHGNLNNDIGVPLTLLRLSDEHDYAVVEMGANHAGEIAELCTMARPSVGVVTNAGRAHLEGFHSIDGVARAKGELFAELPESGIGVVNIDDPYATLWQENLGSRQTIGFGTLSEAAVRTTLASVHMELLAGSFVTRFELVTPIGECSIALRVAGLHNVYNALAATAAAIALGIDLPQIKTGLESVAPVGGRLAVSARRDGGWIIDDTYNANPDSVLAALSVLALCPGERWLVVGDMAELGSDSAELHAHIGELARNQGVTRLWALGELASVAVSAFGEGGEAFVDFDAMTAAMHAAITPQTAILVKGSRRMRMERVVAQFGESTDGEAR